MTKKQTFTVVSKRNSIGDRLLKYTENGIEKILSSEQLIEYVGKMIGKIDEDLIGTKITVIADADDFLSLDIPLNMEDIQMPIGAIQ
jgi:hypothetical protein